MLDEQPDILGINRKYSYDALKDILTKWLNPEDEAATEAPIASKDEEEEDDFITEINKPVTPAYTLAEADHLAWEITEAAVNGVIA